MVVGPGYYATTWSPRHVTSDVSGHTHITISLIIPSLREHLEPLTDTYVHMFKFSASSTIVLDSDSVVRASGVSGGSIELSRPSTRLSKIVMTRSVNRLIHSRMCSSNTSLPYRSTDPLGVHSLKRSPQICGRAAMSLRPRCTYITPLRRICLLVLQLILTSSRCLTCNSRSR